jgi:hypothetical protein
MQALAMRTKKRYRRNLVRMGVAVIVEGWTIGF